MDKDQFICESIVRAVKSGLVPARGLERIAVGRDGELRQIRRDLVLAAGRIRAFHRRQRERSWTLRDRSGARCGRGYGGWGRNS